MYVCMHACMYKFLMKRHLTKNWCNLTLESTACLRKRKFVMIPGTRGSTSMLFTTDVKEETLGPTVVYSALVNTNRNRRRTRRCNPRNRKSLTNALVYISSIPRQVLTI